MPLRAAELRDSESERVRTASRAVPRLIGAQGKLAVSATGRSWAQHEAVEQSQRDLLRAELVAAPLVLFVLVAAYGSLVAKLVPLAIGLLSVVGALAVLRLLGHFMEVSAFAANITTALGFGLAVDYGLFLVARFRETAADGLPLPEAVAETVRTAGRAVCPGCKVDVDSPEPPPTCPEAETLYRAWFTLWRKEVRR
ncbi:MMPL family transporter [Streptomyces sp. NPDC087856]|uniref:MMPL family transporter n=1 Tax=Streptomyces sp. NPDC087856 TaxID=3365811 RepID=UPI0038050FA3